MDIIPHCRAGNARFRPEISNEGLQRQARGRDSVGAVPDWRRSEHLRLETDDPVRLRLLNRSLRSLATVNGLDRIDTSAPDSETYSPRLSPSQATTCHCGLDWLLESSSALETLRVAARVSRFSQDGQMQAGSSSDIHDAQGRYSTTRRAAGTPGPWRQLRSRGCVLTAGDQFPIRRGQPHPLARMPLRFSNALSRCTPY